MESGENGGFDGPEDEGPEEFEAGGGFDAPEPADDHAETDGPEMPDAPISGSNDDEQ